MIAICPTKTDLQLWLTKGESANGFADHVASCSHCQNTLDRLSDDTGLRDMAVALNHTDTAAELQTLSTTPSTSPIAPTKIGPFVIESELGRGGMGIVYRAIDEVLKRPVAVKLLRRDLFRAVDQERLMREARSAARVRHKNVVDVHTAGVTDDGTPYLVMEYIAGPTLAERIRELKRLRAREAAELAAQIADGLAAAHAAGLIHRDVKPSNILVGSGQWAVGSGGQVTSERWVIGNKTKPSELPTTHCPLPTPKLADFGLVHDDLAASALTAEGTIAGTPAYLSPEQASGKNADARSDVYGLGVTLYESLVGEVPFRGPAIEVLRQVLDDEPRPPRQLDATIPRDLETIVLKSLAKEPARRYQRADEFAADLRRWLNNEPILARPAGRVERTWRWCRRNPKLATLTGLVVTLLTALAVGGTTAAVLISRAYDRAETNRVQAVASQKQAESDADVALKSLVTLVETVQKQMGNQPGLLPLKRKLLETAAEGLKAVVHSPSDAERADRIAVMAHERLGDVYVELGRSADAQAEFSEAHRHAEAWAAREADNINAQRGVAAACDRLGDSAHDAKKTDEAREWYGKAHAQRRRRFEMTPTNAIAVRDLSVSLNKLGDTEEKANDFEAALAHHSESLRLTEQLLPGGDAVLRLQDLRFVRNRLVNVCVSLVDFDAAESHARAGLEHAREYAKIDAVAGRFEIANALERVALVAVYRFDPAGAVLCREESVALRRAMVAADPGNVAAQRNLAVALSAYAGVQVLARNVDAARSAYDEALRLNQAVAAIDPDSVPVWFAQQGIYVLLIGLEANAGRYAEATAWASQAVEFYRRSEENPKLAHLNPKDHRVDMEEIREAGLIAVRAGLADASAFDAQPLGIRRRLRRMRVLDLAIQGKADEAVAAAAELTSRTSETNALEHLVAARACAIVGRAEPAIAALTEAIRLAPMTARELVFYADFYPLRDRSDFQALLPKPKGQK